MLIGDLNHNQKKAIAAFLDPGNKTIQDIANSCGLSERTIYQYLADPAFKAELSARQNMIINLAFAGLADLQDQAIAEYKNMVEDEQISPAVKRLICKDIITLADKLISDRSIESRIMELEKVVFNG